MSDHEYETSTYTFVVLKDGEMLKINKQDGLVWRVKKNGETEELVDYPENNLRVQELINRAQAKLASKDDTGWRDILSVSEKLASFSVQNELVEKFRSYLKITDPPAEETKDAAEKVKIDPQTGVPATPETKEPQKKKSKKSSTKIQKKEELAVQNPETEQSAVESAMETSKDEKGLETTQSLTGTTLTESSISDTPVESVKRKRKKSTTVQQSETAQATPVEDEKDPMILIPLLLTQGESKPEEQRDVQESIAESNEASFKEVDDLVLNILANISSKKHKPVKPRPKSFIITKVLAGYDTALAEQSACLLYSRLKSEFPLL